MNQPDLGQKVVEIRKQKGLTQERLAELGEVNTRTIQRIESGEVDPRSYTLQLISQVLEFNFDKDHFAQENLLVVLLHLSGVICNMLIPFNVLIPLIIWSWKKNQSMKIDKQGQQVLNFQITMTLFLLVFAMLMMLILLPFSSRFGINIDPSGPLAVFSPLPMVLVVLFNFIQSVINAIRSIYGKPIRYWLGISFIR